VFEPTTPSWAIVTVHPDPCDHDLLAQRARRLAARADPADDGARQAGFGFRIGVEEYAVDPVLVCGAFRLLDLAPLPGAAPEVVGVAVWRGVFLRIVDLQVILGAARSGLDDRAMVVALGERAPRLGLLATGLSGMVSLDTASASSDHRSGTLIWHVTANAVQLLDAAELIRTFG
jgi:chemotaxis signal transduction protein